MRKNGERTQRTQCRDCVNKSNLIRYHERSATKESHRKASYRYLVRKYGLSVEDYESMLNTQDYKCKICGIKEYSKGKRLNIDHDHKTGKIRDLLCHNCNTALGHIDDNVETLKKMINYLETWNRF